MVILNKKCQLSVIIPSLNEGKIIRGEAVTSARMIDFEVELPQQPKSASFFTVQGQDSAEGI